MEEEGKFVMGTRHVAETRIFKAERTHGTTDG